LAKPSLMLSFLANQNTSRPYSNSPTPSTRMIHEADRPRKAEMGFENSAKASPLVEQKMLFPYSAFLSRDELFVDCVSPFRLICPHDTNLRPPFPRKALPSTASC
jgi:hypothetical protein